MSLLRDRLQDVAWASDLRQIELSLDLIFAGARARFFSARCRAFGELCEVLTYALGFVVLDGAGVGLLFGDADQGQDVKDRLALDFQFPCQIVDSSLHPPLGFLRVVLPPNWS
jgi:hypothetical protein